MSARLAGNNILVLEASSKEAKRLCEGFKKLGANVSTASSQVKSVSLQKGLDFDIVICDVSFLTGLAEVVIQEANSARGKPSPLLFVYGDGSLIHPKLFETKGVLKYFAGAITPEEVAGVISGYLYDAQTHLKQLMESNLGREISFVLKTGVDTFTLEVSDFSDEGLISPLKTGMDSETGSLTVIVPDGATHRFAVRLERKGGDGDTILLKTLWRDRERWVALLNLVDLRQKQIIDFLKASSGK